MGPTVEDKMAGTHNVTPCILMKGDERTLKRTKHTAELGKDGTERRRSGWGPRRRIDGVEGPGKWCQ